MQRALWPSVRALAEALLACEEMGREHIDEVIGGRDIRTPVFAIQRAHGLLQAPRV